MFGIKIYDSIYLLLNLLKYINNSLKTIKIKLDTSNRSSN